MNIINVLYFIGNGFDLNVGLKTRFIDALPSYIKKETTSDVINLFKEAINKNFVSWANFEEEMGLYTDKIAPRETPIETFLEYSKCIMDFKNHMIDYLKKEEEKVLYTDKKDIAKLFLDSLFAFKHYLGVDTSILNEEIDKNKIKFSYINFNYTKVFDKCLDILKDENIFNLKKKVKDGFFYFDVFNELGEVEHIHGTLDKGFILGVNDVKQIANISFHNLEKMDTYIKPNANDKLENNKNSIVQKLINAANIYCIYGMSLGKTDKKWWIEIAKQMICSPDKKLVIYVYDKGYNGALIEDTIETGELCKISFLNNLKFTDLDKEDIKKNLKQRIHVAINADLFKLKLL